MNEFKPPSYDKSGGDVRVSASCIPPGFVADADAGPSTSCINPTFQPDEILIKPPTAPLPDYIPEERPPIINLGTLTGAEVRDACLQYASEHCCYGKKFVRDTALTEILNSCAYHYRLETFGEKRETAQRTTPFKGQPIDGPENGPPPDPWMIPIPITEMFVDKKATTEVPHTAYVKECWNCVGNRRVRCDSCNGRGGERCWSCSGSGRSGARPCGSCSGTGHRRCTWCSGTGQVKCKTCDGRGRLKHFIQMIVTWKNHIGDFVSDTGDLPKEKILQVTGREIFKEQQLKVYPINHCPDLAVNNASVTLIRNHERSFHTELVRMQRQTLRAIPVTKAKYLWRERQGDLYVYGFQNKVYFEDYPQKCCCCTCI